MTVSLSAPIIYAYLCMHSLHVNIYIHYIWVNFDQGCKINIGSSMGKILELVRSILLANVSQLPAGNAFLMKNLMCAWGVDVFKTRVSETCQPYSKRYDLSFYSNVGTCGLHKTSICSTLQLTHKKRTKRTIRLLKK